MSKSYILNVPKFISNNCKLELNLDLEKVVNHTIKNNKDLYDHNITKFKIKYNLKEYIYYQLIKTLHTITPITLISSDKIKNNNMDIQISPDMISIIKPDKDIIIDYYNNNSYISTLDNVESSDDIYQKVYTENKDEYKLIMNGATGVGGGHITPSFIINNKLFFYILLEALDQQSQFTNLEYTMLLNIKNTFSNHNLKATIELNNDDILPITMQIKEIIKDVIPA